MSTSLAESLKLKEAAKNAGVRQPGHVVLKSGRHSDIKIDMEKVVKNPSALSVIQGGVKKVARPHSKILIPVPSGATKIMTTGSGAEDIALLMPNKTDNGNFSLTDSERQALRTMRRASIVEDVVTTAGSAAEVARLVRAENPELDLILIGMWRRGNVLPKNAREFSDQIYLIEEELPDWLSQDCPYRH